MFALFIVLYIPVITAKKRNKLFIDFATSNNYKAIFNNNTENIIKTHQFSLFKEGIFKNIERIVAGNINNLKFILFDYKYIPFVSSKKGYLKQTIIILETNKQIPEFKITPENIFDKIKNAVGFSDINFDSNPEFSSAFKLIGKDEKQIREFFNPSLLTYFESFKNFTIESVDNNLMFYIKNKLIQSEQELYNFLNSILKINELL